MVRHVGRPDWALILGGASCVWDDVAAWEAEYGREWDGLVIVANDIGAHWSRPIDHWVSLHPEKIARWQELRRELQHDVGPAPHTWGRQFRMYNQAPRVTDEALVPWAGGSSGMFAVQVAHTIGCRRAILCGIPMTMTPHFTESRERFHAQWVQANGHWKAWGRYLPKMTGWVRSMSGRTRELLGAPTREWLTSTTVLHTFTGERYVGADDAGEGAGDEG